MAARYPTAARNVIATLPIHQQRRQGSDGSVDLGVGHWGAVHRLPTHGCRRTAGAAAVQRFPIPASVGYCHGHSTCNHAALSALTCLKDKSRGRYYRCYAYDTIIRSASTVLEPRAQSRMTCVVKGLRVDHDLQWLYPVGAYRLDVYLKGRGEDAAQQPGGPQRLLRKLPSGWTQCIHSRSSMWGCVTSPIL